MSRFILLILLVVSINACNKNDPSSNSVPLSNEAAPANSASSNESDSINITEGVDYWYRDNTCKENCITNVDAEKLCGKLKGLTALALAFHALGSDMTEIDATLLNNGEISNLEFNWSGNDCKFSFYMSGIHNGSSARGSYYGRVKAFTSLNGKIYASMLSRYN